MKDKATTRIVLNLVEAAAAVGIHPNTMRKACREGRLRHARAFGNRIVITPEDLRAFVLGRASGGVKPEKEAEAGG